MKVKHAALLSLWIWLHTCGFDAGMPLSLCNVLSDFNFVLRVSPTGWRCKFIVAPCAAS